MRNTAVNQSAYQHILSLLDPKVSVAGLRVKGKWLEALLDNGIKFSVKNNRVD